MKIKTKLWGLTALIVIMLVAMVSVVYVKGRSTMIGLTNVEGKDTAERTAAVADTYLQGIAGVTNNLVPITKIFFYS